VSEIQNVKNEYKIDTIKTSETDEFIILAIISYLISIKIISYYYNTIFSQYGFLVIFKSNK